MLANWWKGGAELLVALCVLFCTNSYAQTDVPYQEVHTVADTAHAVPVEHSVDITVAGTYQVTLTDLGASFTPSAPLASVKLAITSGGTLVGTQLSGAGTTQFNAAVGTYIIHVVGAPGTAPGSGPIGLKVTGGAGNAVVASFSDTLALPTTGLPSNESTLDDSFSVGSSGNYVVTLADLQFPQALTTVTLIVTTTDGTIITNPPLAAAGSTTVALQQGVTYRIFAAGQSDPTVNAGLYTAVVTPSGGGTPVYSKAIPVGTVSAAQSVTLTGGTSYTLTLTDLALPSALSKVSALVTFGGQVVAQLNAKGTSPAFTATSGTYQVFALASPGSSGGSYAVAVTPQGGAPVLSFARAVTTPGGAATPYSFDATVSTAGSYNFNLTDFGIPSTMAALSAVVVQGGTVLGSPLTTAGTQAVTAAVGPVSILVFAQAATPGGLLEADLTPAAGGTPAFATTQGVGQLFSARQLSITSAGTYAANVADLAWPAALSTFAVIVTQGSTKVGSIYGGGAFAFDATTPGSYFVNFIAQPAGSDGAGTYALNVAAGPTISLQSSATTAPSGGTVNLTWTVENATGCTASGGWSGAQALSGSFTSTALTASTTFTLTCTGEGVSVDKSVTVTVQAPPPSKGGGGALGIGLVAALFAVLIVRLWFGSRPWLSAGRPG